MHTMVGPHPTLALTPLFSTSSKEITMKSPFPSPTPTISPTQTFTITLSNGTSLVLTLTLPFYFSPHPPRCHAEDLHFEDDYDETADEYLSNNESCVPDPEYDRLYRYMSTRIIRVPVSRNISKKQLVVAVESEFSLPILMEEVQIMKGSFDVTGDVCDGGNGYEKEYQHHKTYQEQQEKHEHQQQGHENGLREKKKHSQEEKWRYYEQTRNNQHQHHQYQVHPNPRGPYRNTTHTSTPYSPTLKNKLYEHTHERR